MRAAVTVVLGALRFKAAARKIPVEITTFTLVSEFA